MDESTLLSQAIAGDDEALVKLLKTYAGMLESHVRELFPRRYASLVSIEDVLQSVYSDVFSAIGKSRFAAPGEFPAWLRRIASNNVRDLVRYLEADKRGGGAMPLALDAETASQQLLIDVLPVQSAAPSRDLRRKEAAEIVQRALLKLPEEHRFAIQLVVLEGRSNEQAAEIADCSVGALRVRLWRAHGQLREILNRDRTIFRSSL